MKCYSFPSAIEAHDYKMQSVVPHLVDGLKIQLNGSRYLVGELALREGVAPHKIINSDPAEVDYQLLGQAGLLLAGKELSSAVALTVGFPYTTFQRYAAAAAAVFKGTREIEYEVFSFGRANVQKLSLHVEKVEAIPEILACATFVKEQKVYGSPVFVVSLGYGTMEAALVGPGGLVERTLVSTHGLRFAVQSVMRELQKEHYLDMRTEHQFDRYFQANSLVIRRKKVDLAAIRREAIRKYYTDVISPAIRNRWTDDDFYQAGALVLVGGGAAYPEMVACFSEEFADVLTVQAPAEPALAAVSGYTLWSRRNVVDGLVPVGLDIGNAYTAVGIADAKPTED